VKRRLESQTIGLPAWGMPVGGNRTGIVEPIAVLRLCSNFSRYRSAWKDWNLRPLPAEGNLVCSCRFAATNHHCEISKRMTV
jgi:hypothetical protein